MIHRKGSQIINQLNEAPLWTVISARKEYVSQLDQDIFNKLTHLQINAAKHGIPQSQSQPFMVIEFIRIILSQFFLAYVCAHLTFDQTRRQHTPQSDLHSAWMKSFEYLLRGR